MVGAGIAGMVYDSTGKPVIGAMIKVTGPKLAGFQGAATGADGRYVIPFLPVGQAYQVEAEAPGLGYAVRTVDLELDKTSEVDLTLDPARTAPPEPPEPEEEDPTAMLARRHAFVAELAPKLTHIYGFVNTDDAAQDLVNSHLDDLRGFAGLAGPIYGPLFVMEAAAQRIQELAEEYRRTVLGESA